VSVLGVILGATDAPSIMATGAVGSLFVAFSVFYSRGAKLQADTYKETILEIRKENKHYRSERDEAQRKLMLKSAYVELVKYDVKSFLKKKGINPDEFVFPIEKLE
jgi:hypothetical protein